MDEPFFNFDSEDMDDEELYCESLLEELKKQQVCCRDYGKICCYKDGSLNKLTAFNKILLSHDRQQHFTESYSLGFITYSCFRLVLLFIFIRR